MNFARKIKKISHLLKGGIKVRFEGQIYDIPEPSMITLIEDKGKKGTVIKDKERNMQYNFEIEYDNDEKILTVRAGPAGEPCERCNGSGVEPNK